MPETASRSLLEYRRGERRELVEGGSSVGEVAALRSAALALVGSLFAGMSVDVAMAQNPVVEETEDRVAVYVAAVRGGVTKDMVSLRRDLRSASDKEIERIGERLRSTDHHGVRVRLAALLADIGSDAADDALRANLFAHGEFIRSAATALVRRRTWVSLTDEEREVVVCAASAASPVRLGSLLRLLVADRAAPEGGVGAAVSLVLERIVAARPNEEPASRHGEFGATGTVVLAGAAALRTQAVAALAALRERTAASQERGTWSATAERFVLVLRALLGDASVTKETLAAASDPQHGVDAQLLAIKALPRVAGEPARPVLRSIVESTESESEARPRRTNSPRTPARRLRLAATEALATLDDARDEE